MHEVKVIDSIPAAYLPGIDTVAVADLHLGLEASMTSKGYYVPEFQLETLKGDLETLKQETEASRLVINGDLKTQYSTSYSEKQEVEEFLEKASTLFEEVVVVLGNHDTYIRNAVEDHGLRPLESFSRDGVLFVHGHEEVEEDAELVVIGHEHPAIVLEDGVGTSEKVPCMLHGELEEFEVLVLPAFSEIAQGTEINQLAPGERLSPVLQGENLSEFKVTAISREGGVFDFGTLSNLQ